MMNTATCNGSIADLWHYLQGLSLSPADSQWLADKLVQNTKKEETPAAKELVFPHIDDDFKPSEAVLARVLGPVPEGLDIDKELELMWEDWAK